MGYARHYTLSGLVLSSAVGLYYIGYTLLIFFCFCLAGTDPAIGTILHILLFFVAEKKFK